MSSFNSKAGLIGGLAGGLVFGLMMSMLGMMPLIAKLVGSDSVAVGWAVHIVISLIIGFSYAWWFGRKTVSCGSGTGFGLLHGVIWWVLGPLLVMPVLMGMGPQFANMFATMNMLSLMGHLVYGVITGLTYFAVAKK